MKNKVLVAMGIGISAALAASCFTVDAKADEADLQKIAEDNKANDGTTIVEEESTNEDLNNDGDKEDKYEVVNDADAWNQITDDPISDDSTQFNDAVELATVTFTDTFKEEYNEATDPNAGIKYEQDLTDLESKGYTIDESGSTLVTDREAIDPDEDENKDLDPDELAARKTDLSKDYPDLVVSADENALEALKTDYIDNKGYDADKVVIEKDTNGTAIGKITATKEIGSGSMDADPVVGATVTSSDGKTYTISEIKSGGFLVLIDDKGVTYDATWDKFKTGDELKLISKDEFDKLSDEEKSITPDYSSSSKAVATLDNLSEFAIVALNDFENNGNINPSIYVGGTYTGGKYDGNDVYIGNKVPSLNPQSYINDLPSDTTTKFCDGNINNGSTRKPNSLSSDQISATTDYWTDYVALLEKSGAGTKVTDDFTGAFSTGNGNSSSMNHENKVYYTSEALTIIIKRLDGILVAPNATVIIKDGDSDKTDCFAGVVIANNVKNYCHVGLSNENTGLLSKLYGVKSPIYERTWDGENHVETQERYKVSADKINHLEYKLVAHKDTSKTFYGERYVAPDLPPAGPDLPPAGPDVPPTGPDTPPTPPTPPAGPTPAAPPTLAPAPVAPAAPAAAPDGDVLGARRGNGGSVLGARRSLAPAVLGKKRAPETGDTMAVFGWLAALMGTLSGAGVSAKALKKTKKEDK